VLSDPSDDVLGRLNHLLIGTGTGDPSDLPPAPPVPAPDILVILTGTDDIVTFVSENQVDHGPCSGTTDPASPQIPIDPCEAFYGIATQAKQASPNIKVLYATLPLTTSQYQNYTPALSTAEQRFNLYLQGPGLTGFGETGIIDLSASLKGNWTDDGRSFNQKGADEATKAVQTWITNMTASR